MKISTVPACLLLGLMLAFTGCAKPPVRSYPRPIIYDQSSGPRPRVSPEKGTGAEKEARGPEESPPATDRTAPPASYDKPLAPVGTQPAVESSAGGDYLLAAVTPLADQASRQLANGELDSAQTTAERAVRIDPNNADLWHLMGKIQLARENFSQAEQLARKSNLLAKGNTDLQARNWRIIAESLRRRNNNAAAEAAMEKARALESR
jgi:hypothetical protein